MSNFPSINLGERSFSAMLTWQNVWLLCAVAGGVVTAVPVGAITGGVAGGVGCLVPNKPDWGRDGFKYGGCKSFTSHCLPSLAAYPLTFVVCRRRRGCRSGTGSDCWMHRWSSARSGRCGNWADSDLPGDFHGREVCSSRQKLRDYARPWSSLSRYQRCPYTARNSTSSTCVLLL